MVYWEIFKFRFLRFFAYPVEILASVLKRFVEIVFLIFFWTLIARNLSETSISQITSYFLLSTGISELVMGKYGYLESEMGRAIRYGRLNNYLVKPLSIIPVLYANGAGRNGVRLIVAAFYIVLGLVITPPTPLNLPIFILFFIAAFLVAFALNLIMGTMFFYMTDANGVTNSIQHVSRVFSGALVPLYLFPDHLERLALLTPFPAMIYGPTQVLLAKSVDTNTSSQLTIALMWAFTLNLLGIILWRRAIKSYEAIGI